jgi:hypothetical protein
LRSSRSRAIEPRDLDPLKLIWLGSLSSFATDAYILVVNARHPAKTVADLAAPAPPTLIGGDSPGSTNLTFALVAAMRSSSTSTSRTGSPERQVCFSPCAMEIRTAKWWA